VDKTAERPRKLSRCYDDFPSHRCQGARQDQDFRFLSALGNYRNLYNRRAIHAGETPTARGRARRMAGPRAIRVYTYSVFSTILRG